MYIELKNNIDFFIRNKLKISRKNFVERDESVLARNFLENLYTFDVLDKFFEKIEFEQIKVLDIGCKNWFYARGEYEYFKSFCNDFELDGVELDAYRLYSNFYSRYEVAKFYTKNLENTNYIADDLLKVSKKYHYIIWFLPFVTKYPLEKWGLPKRFFMPEKLLEHAYSLLSNGGQMLIINQGEGEYNVQKSLLDSLGIKYEEKGIVKSDFLEYKNKRYAILVKK